VIDPERVFDRDRDGDLKKKTAGRFYHEKRGSNFSSVSIFIRGRVFQSLIDFKLNIAHRFLCENRDPIAMEKSYRD
jgi:hypothetical protein